MRKVSENLVHQGWVDDEGLAHRPGQKIPVMKVPISWIERSARAVCNMEGLFGYPTRTFRVAGAIWVVFRSGVVLSFPCPLRSMDAYLAALRLKLAEQRKAA